METTLSSHAPVIRPQMQTTVTLDMLAQGTVAPSTMATTMTSAGTRMIVVPAPRTPAAPVRADMAATRDGWTVLSRGTAINDPVVALPDPDSDQALIAAARAGDLDAFNAIITRHERAVFNVALRILREPAAAEDAAQDALLKAWTAIGTFNGEVILPWLIRIVTNRCYDIIRARNRRPADSLDQEDLCETSSWSTQVSPSESPSDFVDRSELSSRLQSALDALSPDHRAVVILSDVHGYGYDEIAASLGVAVGTVKSRLCRGRSRLRQLLRDELRPLEPVVDG
ncbi:MAG: hypothetical protein AVDCRST_MAG33-1487 [uncultured Thermomicrobiales bacterium]|uniref:RNA polymerase ECF-type sigma factor n=1 Tax=uncultured Thermomicrobiales bacterium TaxID=1645740 RepID=A0A6J4UUN3_9BACT|nr:MAG: hypothetical protein AVDCRST_MAG33-1487 [uncultured Thermomicrobiales bacterium]